MAEAQSPAAAAAATQTATQTATGSTGLSLLDQAISLTKQTEPDRTQELLRALTQEAMKGTVKFDRNLTQTINKAIASIDQALSTQLSKIMHDPKFLKLEGSWRGLHHLVSSSETNSTLKIKVLNASKRDLYRDLTRATEFDQSTTFKKVYEDEFGQSGGEPYGALIGDYQFSHHPEDIELLERMSNVAAAAFAPFISAASPQMFGYSQFSELAKTRDVDAIFKGAEYSKWRSFRDSDDSRYVSLVMPAVLARSPYGAASKTIDEFSYEETSGGELPHGHYCWMNAAYVMGSRLTNAFSQYGWCTAIRGAEGGGKVEGLPLHIFPSADGDADTKCPTEVAIPDRREAELGRAGFLPLAHYKNTDYAVFFGAQTCQKPKRYDKPDATANAEISARLPFILASSRIAHALKIMGRDKVGSFAEQETMEKELNTWINNYVNANPTASAENKARFPLREANIQVTEVPGSPGSFTAVAHLRPWLQMEELTQSLRMVARFPKKA